jgi:hypothetical protein
VLLSSKDTRKTDAGLSTSPKASRSSFLFGGVHPRPLRYQLGSYCQSVTSSWRSFLRCLRC